MSGVFCIKFAGALTSEAGQAKSSSSDLETDSTEHDKFYDYSLSY